GEGAEAGTRDQGRSFGRHATVPGRRLAAGRERRDFAGGTATRLERVNRKSMTYYVIYAIVVFAGLAMMVREGLWSNTITLVNILISGLVAFGFYSPLVVYLDEDVTSGQHTYWLDFAIIWALFTVTMLVCRTLTAQLSKTRMRFKHPIDPVGGPIVGLLAAWVLAAFTLAT